MATCLIGLGSNLGDRAHHLQLALESLRSRAAIRVCAVSAFYDTAPVGGPASQPRYLNACARLETHLSPTALLATLLEIEQTRGRERSVRFGPRTVDLDLLLYDELQLALPALQVPHPRMSYRRFVLEPAVEVAAEMRHPTIDWSIAELLGHLNQLPNYVALAGPPGGDKLKLVRNLARRLPGHQVLQSPLMLAHAPSLDSSDHDLRGELALLQHRTARLAPLPPRGKAFAQGSVFLSDFWLEQSLVYGHQTLLSTHVPLLEAAWEQASELVRPPKLLVWVPGSASTDRMHATLTAKLLARVQRPHRGPTLLLSADSLEGREEELLTALKAL